MLEEVERQFGTREFVGVHARVEADWEQQCQGAQNRSDPATLLFSNKHQCWVSCTASADLCHCPNGKGTQSAVQERPGQGRPYHPALE